MEFADIEKLSVDEKLQLIERIEDTFDQKVQRMPCEFDNLSVEKRFELIGDIWDSIDQKDIPIPEWQLQIAEERLAESRRTGQHGQPAREVIERICRNL